MDLKQMADVCCERIEAAVRESEVPGVAVAAIMDGKSLLDAGIGHADLQGTRPVDRELGQPLYSITKLVLATAVMRLVEQERLALDRPLAELLTEYPVDPDITLERLLNHTSGLPDYGALPEYTEEVRRSPGRPWTDAEFFERAMGPGTLFAPGEGWAYSNLGYMLVRLVVEHATGNSLGEALDELVFVPFGLRRTHVVETVNELADLAPGYSRQLDTNGALHLVNGRYHPGWVAHGLVASTAAETASLLEGLFTGRLVGKESLGRMLTAVPVHAEHPCIRQPGYGLGLMLDRASPFGNVAGHAGGGPGFATAAFHFSDVHGHALTVAALANGDSGDLGTRVVFEVVEAVSEALDTTPIVER